MALCVAALLCGCRSSQETSGLANAYYLNPHVSLPSLGRVALVELDNMSAYPNMSADITEALFVAIQKKQVFGLSVVHQNEPAWQGLQQNLESFQALKQLLTMREALKCNGILVGTITQYQPYPHATIGLRLKLLDLTDGQLLWGLEHVWDSADGNIQKRIKKYFTGQLSTSHAPQREELVIVSPANFAKFAAYEIAETLDGEEK